MPLVTMVLVPPLPHNLQRPSNDLCHAPGFCTIYTILPLRLLAEVLGPILTSSFQGTSFVAVLGSTKLPTPGPVMESHETSLLSPMLPLGLRSFVMTTPSLDVVLMMPQTK